MAGILSAFGIGRSPAAGSYGSPQPAAPGQGGILGYKPSFFEVLDGVLGGRTITDSRQDALMREAGRRQAAQGADERQQLKGLAADLSPEDKLLYLLDPKGFAGARLKGQEPQVVAGGSSVYRNGGFQTAPKIEQFGDRFGTTQGDGSVVYTKPRDPTFAEQTDKALAEEKLTQGKFDRLTGWAPEGFRPELGPNGQPTGNAKLDPAFRDFDLARKGAGSTRVTTNVQLPAQNAFAEAYAKQYATDLSGAREAATKADRTLRTLSEAKALLDSGNVITGAGAGFRLNADRLGALAGKPDSKSRVAATQVFEAQMKQPVLDIIKALGSGSAISDADRQFVQKIVGGDIALDSKSLGRLIEIQQREAQATVSRFQNMGQEAFSSVPSAQGLPRSAFQTPAAAIPPRPVTKSTNAPAKAGPQAFETPAGLATVREK